MFIFGSQFCGLWAMMNYMVHCLPADEVTHLMAEVCSGTEGEVLSPLQGHAIRLKDLLGFLNSHNFPTVPLWTFGEFSRSRVVFLASFSLQQLLSPLLTLTVSPQLGQSA